MMAGFYTAASGLLTQQRNIDVIGNNIANSQTTGYRSKRLVTDTFDHTYLAKIENGEKKYIGSGSPLVITREVEDNFDETSLKETQYPYDVAIAGGGYFSIQGQNNTYYTRNGHFELDAEGYLELQGTGRVLGENGEPIWVGGDDLVIDNDGYVFDTNGNYAGRLAIVEPSEGSEMKLMDNEMYVCDNPQNLENYTVYQKMLERSNVDMNQEYTRLIEAQRAYQACSNAITILDGLNSKTASLASIT